MHGLYQLLQEGAAEAKFNHYLIYGMWQHSKNYCRKHTLELNILGVPLAKNCTLCGKTQPLRQWEVSWPAFQPRSQLINRIWNRSKPEIVLSARVIASVFLIAVGSAFAWKELNPFGSAAPHRNPRTEIQVINSSAPSAVNAPVDASDDTRMKVAAIRQNVRSNPPPKGTGNARPTSRSFTGPAEPDQVASERTDMQSAVTIESDVRESQHSSHVRVSAAPSHENQIIAPVTSRGSNVAERVSKAISARAISGVKVSYVKSTLYLEGEVKTQTQRLAAERTARNTPGVKRIRSSIRVKWVNDSG